MDIHSVIMRALSDRKFAEELQEAATKAVEAGVGSSEHKQLLSMFNMSENSAAQMYPVAHALAAATSTNNCPVAGAGSVDLNDA
jgi:hypothetical protein